MRHRTIVLTGGLTTIAVGAVALAIAAQRTAPPRPAASGAERTAATSSGSLPVMWQVPPFSFANQHGRTTATADLRGHVWIADFVFTRCTTICPLITAKMALLQRRLPERNLRFVSFSVDPEHDTPEALKRYAAEWRPSESRWLLFSTTPGGLQRLASAMYVSVKPVDNDIAHSNLFFLVDQQGGVRGIYESDKNDAIERLVRDAETLSEPSPAVREPSAKASTGSELYAAVGCAACHARSDLAPPLEGLVGRRVELAGGGELTADAAYIRESIVAPDAKLTRSHVLRMPSYEKELTPSELDALVDHVANLGRTPPPAAAKPTVPAAVVVDPVCAMKVRVVETTPRASHAGRTAYFCSEMCRDRFVSEPARYTVSAR